jgi:PIN domain nuclease of toxin-antitoxin system
LTRFLLDTDAFLLLGFGLGQVSASTRLAVRAGQRLVSHVSAIEIGIKHSIGKLPLPPVFDTSFEHGFSMTARELSADVLPIKLEHAAVLARLPLHHRDPFDRLLIAQAVTERLTIVTRDRKFSLYPGLNLLEL